MSFCLSHFAGHISLVPFVFFQSIHYFFGRVCGCVGGLGGVEKLAIKLSLAQLSWAGAWNELGNDKRWCWYQIILTNISIFILKTDAHVFCSYARARARIDLKFFLVMKLWWINLSLKFEKDLISGCGEIDSQSWSISIKITENTLILKDQDQLKEFWNWGEAPLRFQ